MNDVSRFKVLYGNLSITICTYSSFIIMYLKWLGYSNTEVGLISSLNIGLAILGQLFWGYICDLKSTIKKILVFNLSMLILVALTLSMVSSHSAILVCIALFGFLQSSLMALTESWVLNFSNQTKKNFGAIRAWSSIGWALCALAMGKVIDLLGWKSMFIAYAIFALSTVIYMQRIEDIKEITKKDKNQKVNPLELLRIPKYMFAVFMLILFGISQNAMTFLAVIIKEVGGTSNHLGMASFVMAVSELPIFFKAKKLTSKHKLTDLLLFAALMYIVRMVALSFSTSYVHIIIAGVLQMVTFAIFVIGTRFLIAESAPEHLKNSAQTFAGAMGSIVNIIYTMVIGYLTDIFSIKVIYLIGAIGAVLNVLLILFYKFKYENSKITNT